MPIGRLHDFHFSSNTICVSRSCVRFNPIPNRIIVTWYGSVVPTSIYKPSPPTVCCFLSHVVTLLVHPPLYIPLYELWPFWNRLSQKSPTWRTVNCELFDRCLPVIFFFFRSPTDYRLFLGDASTYYRKEVKIGETPVLLSKVKGSYYATSAKCTHYGAPLVKGTLASDGRIMWWVLSEIRWQQPVSSSHWTPPLLLHSPWHGACFNATTGDIGKLYGKPRLSL